MDIKGAGGSLGDSGRQMGDFDQVRRLRGVNFNFQRPGPSSPTYPIVNNPHINITLISDLLEISCKHYCPSPRSSRCQLEHLDISDKFPQHSLTYVQSGSVGHWMGEVGKCTIVVTNWRNTWRLN